MPKRQVFRSREEQRVALALWLEKHKDDPKVVWKPRKLMWGERVYRGPPVWVETPPPAD